MTLMILPGLTLPASEFIRDDTFVGPQEVVVWLNPRQEVVVEGTTEGVYNYFYSTIEPIIKSTGSIGYLSCDFEGED